MEERVYTTVGNRLTQVAREHPDREALVHSRRGVRYSYRSFMEAVEDLGRGLMALGLKKGDHAALWGPNLPQWLITQFALAKIGVVLVALDPGYGAEDLQYTLFQSQAKVLLTAEGPEGSYLMMIRSIKPSLPDLELLITLDSRPFPPFLSLEEVMGRKEETPPSRLKEREESLSPEEPLMLLFTSGTTGKPKGVVSDHLGVLNKSMASTERLKISETDRLCLFFPLFHMFGNTCIALSGLIRGASLVIPSDQFSPPEILAALAAEGCTAIYGSPSMFVALMEHPDFKNFQPGRLRTGIIGGAPCPMALMKRIVEEMGVRELAIAYGITEASSWITQTLPEDPLELRVSTIGRALPNCEVKVVDPISGEDLPDGTPGEICTRRFLMKGYYRNPEATARVVDQEGWFHTGDLGLRDAQGYFRITGRLKDVIMKEGREILPTEIEDILYQNPGVATAQAFGVPDPLTGEKVALWVQPKEGVHFKEEEIQVFCRSHLPKFLVPDYVRIVDSFPMTRSGKMQKFRMREIMAMMLTNGS
jgi:fatty-acyl-CoA synthase